MRFEPRAWIGLGGVPPHDNPVAYRWEKRLHWVMVVVALLSLPAFYLEEMAEEQRLQVAGLALEAFIIFAFSAELAWMLRITTQKLRYVLRNWLDVMIIGFAAASFVGTGTEWVAVARLARLALVALLVARAAGSLRFFMNPGGIPYFIGFSALALLLAGAGFYWLEPTVHSFRDGLWLAFVTGSTVGYGDFVPTTTASRLFAVFMVVIGFTLLSLVTASIASAFIGEDEKRLRREMHNDIRQLRAEVARLVGEEVRAIRREMHRDIRELREEVARLRRDVQASTRERLESGETGR